MPPVTEAGRPPLRLTGRGRVVRALLGGAACLALMMFGQPISVVFFTGVLWFGHLLGA